MQIDQKVLIHNRFDVEVRDSITGELKETAVGFNMVLDQMWTRLCGNLTYFVNIHYGTGTGTLSATRTSLFTHLGTKAAVDVEKIKGLPVSSVKKKITINPEENIGSVLKEVGISFGTASTNLVTHALLKDSEGNTITITKGALDVIIIYATVFVTLIAPEGVKIAKPSVNNSLNNMLLTWLLDGTVLGNLSTKLKSRILSGASLGSSAAMNAVADTVNKRRVYGPTRLDIYTGNGHIKSVSIDKLYEMTLPVSGIYIGESYQNVPIATFDGVNNKFELPSRNIKDGTLVLKKNGSVIVDFTHTKKWKLIVGNAGEYGLTNRFLYHVSFSENLETLTYVGTDYQIVYLSNLSFVYSPGAVSTNGNGYWTATSKDGKYSFLLNESGYIRATFNEDASNTTYAVLWPKINGVENVNWSTGAKLGCDYDGKIVVGGGNIGACLFKRTERSFSAIELPDPYDHTATFNCAVSGDGRVVAFNKIIFDYDPETDIFVKRPDLPNATNMSSSNIMKINSDGSEIYMTLGTTYNQVIKFIWDGTNWTETRVNFTAPFNIVKFDMSNDAKTFVVMNASTNNIMAVFKEIDGVFVSIDTSAYTSPATIVNNYILSPKGDALVYCAGSSSSYGGIFSIEDSTTEVTINGLTTGDVITADYTVDGMHKTDQYVVDVGLTLQFAEGV